MILWLTTQAGSELLSVDEQGLFPRRQALDTSAVGASLLTPVASWVDASKGVTFAARSGGELIVVGLEPQGSGPQEWAVKTVGGLRLAADATSDVWFSDAVALSGGTDLMALARATSTSGVEGLAISCIPDLEAFSTIDGDFFTFGASAQIEDARLLPSGAGARGVAIAAVRNAEGESQRLVMIPVEENREENRCEFNSNLTAWLAFEEDVSLLDVMAAKEGKDEFYVLAQDATARLLLVVVRGMGGTSPKETKVFEVLLDDVLLATVDGIGLTAPEGGGDDVIVVARADGDPVLIQIPSEQLVNPTAEAAVVWLPDLDYGLLEVARALRGGFAYASEAWMSGVTARDGSVGADHVSIACLDQDLGFEVCGLPVTRSSTRLRTHAFAVPVEFPSVEVLRSETTSATLVLGEASTVTYSWLCPNTSVLSVDSLR